jgi:UDP-GlcNAc:undecaprenyl-phosphate GlcNAc-1-phosphate transferase
MAMILEYMGVFAASLILGLFFTPVVRGLALKKNIVARPRNDRWHCRPTALLGGVGIFFAFVCSFILLFIVFAYRLPSDFPIIPLLFSGAAIFILGLADDLFEINSQYKMVGQVIIASVMVFSGFHIDWFGSMTANIMLSIVWIVGITNAFNLLDNMDGLSAGVAVISAFFLFLWLMSRAGHSEIDPGLYMFIVIYMGSILGFLFYNFYPATIFMGDAGSMFIGFMLAAMTMAAGSAGINGGTGLDLLSVVLMPVLILFVPIIDTALVSTTRKMSRRSIFQGGRDHSSHRIVAMGLSEKKAVLLLYAFSASSGLLALFLVPAGIYLSIAVIFLYLIVVVLFWTYLASMDVYKGYNHQGGEKIRCPKFQPDLNPHVIGLLTMIFDLGLITMAYYAAYLLRFEGDMGPNFDFFIKSLPVLYACQITGFYAFGFYQRTWWGSRLVDLAGYVKGVTAGMVLAILVLLFLYRFQSFSRAVFLIYWGLMLILVTFSRSFLRVVDETVHRRNARGKPTLVWGAGVGGQLLVREIESNPGLGLCIKGFMDDNARLAGKKIHGYPVLGGIDRLPDVIARHGIEEIVISFKHNQHTKKSEISNECARCGQRVRVRCMELSFS